MPCPGHGTLDATLDPLGCDLPWEAVYRVRPRPALTCAQCGLPMHAKVSPRGGRFFAHDRRSATCAAAGETEEHRSLKRARAAAAREVGHQAELAVAVARGGWRADVLVTTPGGRLTALEAQLSSASVDDSPRAPAVTVQTASASSGAPTAPRAGSITCLPHACTGRRARTHRGRAPTRS